MLNNIPLCKDYYFTLFRNFKNTPHTPLVNTLQNTLVELLLNMLDNILLEMQKPYITKSYI